VRKASLLLVRSCLAIGLASLPLMAQAQDPVKLAPDAYKVAVDNANVRALDIYIKPGVKMAMHSHPASVLTVYTPCKMRFTSADGKSSEVEFKAGDIVWRDAETHAGENIGTAECHALQVELKHAKAAAKKTK
jgi:quercetin dioxygenase-like cupin family protein